MTGNRSNIGAIVFSLLLQAQGTVVLLKSGVLAKKENVGL
jgi:hypothetical protein